MPEPTLATCADGRQLRFRQLPRRKLRTALRDRIGGVFVHWSSYLGPRRYMLAKTWDLKRRGVQIEGSPLYIAPDVFIDATAYSELRIGHNTVISGGVKLLMHDYSIEKAALACDVDIKTEFRRFGPISIGNEAFIGMGAIILPGVTVGDYAIVGAGSVVTKDVVAKSIVIGNPARPLGTAQDYWENTLLNAPESIFYE